MTSVNLKERRQKFVRLHLSHSLIVLNRKQNRRQNFVVLCINLLKRIEEEKVAHRMGLIFPFNTYTIITPSKPMH